MDIAEYYRLAKIENFHWWYRAMHELVEKMVGKGSTFAGKRLYLKVLDAGCGGGGLTKRLKKFVSVVGIDISEIALKLAGDNRLKLIRGSVNDLPIRSESFDIAVSVSVLYHLQVNDWQAMSELARVLRPDGKTIVILPAFSWWYSSHDRAVYTKRRYTLSQAKQLVEISGFEVLETRYLYSFLFPIFVVKRLAERIFPAAREISDLVLPPKLINDLLFWVCRVEWKLGRILKLPFGSSLLIIGEKKR